MENALIAGYPIVLPAHRASFHRDHPHWHRGWLRSIKKHLQPDAVVVDVGSEQGDLSALVASWVFGGRGVVLIEPQPLFWPTIQATFEANGLKPLRTFMGFATGRGDRSGNELPMSYWPASSTDPVTDPGFYHLNEHQASGLPLDEIAIGDARPDAILIDSEGSELQVLRGAAYLLELLQPQVWCAIHPEIMRDRYGDDPNDLLAFMTDLGYRNEIVGFQGEIHVRFWPH